MPSDERQLIEAAQTGDHGAYRELVVRYQDRVFRFAARLVGNRHDAEDLLQDVFLAAYAHLPSYDPLRASFATWILRITRNKCLNWLARCRPRPNMDEPGAVADQQTNDPLQREFFAQLDEALAALPLEQRAAFVLAEIEQMTYAEIAEVEQTRVGTVKSRVNRAKQKLKQALRPYVEVD